MQETENMLLQVHYDYHSEWKSIISVEYNITLFINFRF